MSETPRTDALIAKHEKETAVSRRCGFSGSPAMVLRQYQEWVMHARYLERELLRSEDDAREEIDRLKGALIDAEDGNT